MSTPSLLSDLGALITGMSNKAAARHLLESGLTGVKGVVYLDEMDRQMVLLRKGTRFPVSPSPPAFCYSFRSSSFSLFVHSPSYHSLLLLFLLPLTTPHTLRRSTNRMMGWSTRLQSGQTCRKWFGCERTLLFL